MAYKINDEIFFLKIDEQVEYLTQVINELYSKDIKIINTNINNLSERINNLNETKQDKTSDELKTEVKNIVGSINELFDKIESETNRAVNSENEISTNLTEFKDHTNTILDSHTSSISSINDSIKSLQDNKQSKIDEQLQTTSKEVVGAINENHNAIVTKVNKSDIINTHVGMSTTYPMTQSAVKNNFWNTVPTDSEVGPSKPAVSNRLFKTGLYVTVPLDNTSIPHAWDPNYDPCPGGTGYGTLLNLVNNGAAGIYRQQAQLYFAQEPQTLYWRFAFNGQDHSDTSNWGDWKRLVNDGELNSKQDKTDNSLATTNKTIVGAINEVNNKIFTDENIDEIKKELNNKANKSDVYTKSEVNDSLNLKLDKASVLQATGTSTTATISQKVITDQLSTKFNKSDSSYHGFIATSVVVASAEAVTTKTLPKTMRNNNYQVFVSPVSSAFNGVIPSWNVPSKTTTTVSIYFKYAGPYDILICEL